MTPTLALIRWLCWACLTILLAVANIAGAQPAPRAVFLPGATGFPLTKNGSPSHGWMIVQSGEKWALVHAPPRVDNDPTATGVLSAAGGSVALVASFTSAPVALAAADDRVYMIFETTDRAGRAIRREVRSITAERSGLGALWRFEPEEELFTHPLLPPGGVLLGAGCIDGMLAVVLDSSTEANPQSPRIGILYRDRWLFTDLPAPIVDAVRASPRNVRIVASRSGLVICVPRADGVLERWTGAVTLPPKAPSTFFAEDDDAPIVTRRNASATTLPSPSWTWTQRPMLTLAPGFLDASAGTLVDCAGVLVWVQVAPDGTILLRELSDDGATPLVDIPGAALPISIGTLDGDGRIVLIWSQLQAPPPTPQALQSSAPKRTYEIREISPSTGRILYAGPAKSLGPVSPTDFRILSIALLVTMGIALLLVLRPDPSDGIITIPEGYFLAESGRRLLAAVADLVFAWWIACTIWRIDVGESISPSNMLGGTTWVVAGTSLAVGMILGAIGEWRVGRSPGKLLAGCEVVSTAAHSSGAGFLSRPSFWRSLERNAIKWLLPPVAMLGLFDQQGRHRADMMARTVVVVRGEEVDEGDLDQ